MRIVGMPDLSGMPAGPREETVAVFAFLRGKYKRIASFNQFGHAQLNFSISAGPLKGWHGVAIEPRLLHLPQRVGRV